MSVLAFKDGDGGGESQQFVNINIKAVSNGWVVESEDTEGNEYVEVYSFGEAEAMIESIKGALVEYD